MTLATEQMVDIKQGRIFRMLGALRTLIIGTLLCLTPPTSIIVLGWLSVDMARVSKRRAGMAVGPVDNARWLFGPPGHGWITRLLGGLARNIRSGFNMAVSLFVATLPFAGFWLAAWWAGWENSFNKGYEQAFVGPLLGLAGIGVFATIMIYLPMAMAHQAVENRSFALFELRRVRSAVAHAGWRYVMLAATTLFFALPIFASRGLPVFAGSIFPGFSEMSFEQVSNLRFLIDVVAAGYIFVSLVILRRWLARIYANAVLRAGVGRDSELWVGSALSDAFAPGQRRTPWRLMRLIQFVLLAAFWGGLSVLIFVGQFLNHDWHAWLTHPYVFLPWPM